jgi:hypothetical protein
LFIFCGFRNSKKCRWNSLFYNGENPCIHAIFTFLLHFAKITPKISITILLIYHLSHERLKVSFLPFSVKKFCWNSSIFCQFSILSDKQRKSNIPCFESCGIEFRIIKTGSR